MGLALAALAGANAYAQNGNGNGNGNGAAPEPTEAPEPNGATEQNGMPEQNGIMEQDEPAMQPYQEPEPTLTEAAAGPASGFGVNVSAGGGVTNFTSEAARDATDVGGSWDVRVGFGTRSILGFEAAYIGNAAGLDVDGLDTDAYVVGNGLEGVARVNVPMPFNTWLLEPFAFGGAGWQRYDLANEEFNTSAVLNEDNLFIIPAGAGLAASYKGIMLDTRFTYRWAFDDSMLGEADMHRWAVSGNIGGEF